MRLDKFLKVSRLIRRRTLAKEVAEGGRIQVNGRAAKPATELKPGDLLTIQFGWRVLQVRVLQLWATASVAEAPDMYEVTSDARVPTEES